MFVRYFFLLRTSLSSCFFFRTFCWSACHGHYRSCFSCERGVLVSAGVCDLGSLLTASFISAVADSGLDQPGCHSCESQNATWVVQRHCYRALRSPARLSHPPLPAPESSGYERKHLNSARCDSR